MRYLVVMFTLAGLLFGQAASADEAANRKIKETVKSILPDMEIVSIEESAIPGLYEVVVGASVIYLTPDGRFALKGDLLDLESRENLTETARANARSSAFKNLDTGELISFGPDNAEHQLYVFTDVDCAYCRRFHSEIGVLNENGVTVHYLAFPRAGVGSKSYKTAVSVWCADDQKKAMTDAKNGKSIVEKECKNPITEQFQMGQSMGIKGTPTLILETGQELGGYIPADQLVKFFKGDS